MFFKLFFFLTVQTHSPNEHTRVVSLLCSALTSAGLLLVVKVHPLVCQVSNRILMQSSREKTDTQSSRVFVSAVFIDCLRRRESVIQGE